MNTMTNNIVRQKAVVDKVCELQTPVSLYGPREDGHGNMYVCSHAGEILRFTDDGDVQVFLTIGGQPNCTFFLTKVLILMRTTIYILQMLLTHPFFTNNKQIEVKNKYKSLEDNKSELQILVKDYEGNPLKGPISLAMNTDENCLLVCDAGNFGSTSLNRATGSIYIVELDSKIPRPLLMNCLAYPADVIFDNSTGITYLVETFTNRIIRFIQNPPGVYHSSIFHQFNGRLGPTAISIDEMGNIYVARYEFQNAEKDVDGLISILNKEGYIVGELVLPKLPEITGMCISSTKKDSLYFTEKSFNGVLKIKLSQFVAEIYKLEENNKLI